MGNADAAVVAADTLGHDMLEGVLDVVRQMPGWDSLTQHQQDVHIDRIDKRIRKLVTDALGILFRGDYPACVAQLVTVAFGSSIKAKIEIPKTAASRHELADAAGQSVVIVMADSEQYFERMKELRGAADQADMFHDSSQPLGHMGIAEPASEGDGLGDVMPPAEPDSLSIPAELTYDQTIELLTKLGLKPVTIEGLNGAATWPSMTPDEWRDAYVWGLACVKFQAEGRLPPAPPSFLVPHMPEMLPEPDPDKAEETPTFAAAGVPQHEAGSPEELIEKLKARGIHVTPKIVKRWSGSQRVAASAWVDGKTDQRPDFLPLPKIAAPGQEGGA